MMRKRKGIQWILGMCLLFVVALVWAEVKRGESQTSSQARQVMEKFIDHYNNRDEQSKLKMILISKTGSERIRQMTIRKITGDDDLEKVMIRFDEPSDIRGTSLLTWEMKAGEDDLQWIYLPALGKTKKISGIARGDHFVESDFTYEDLRPEKLDDYNYTIVKQDGDYFIIDSVPIVKDSIYSRRRIWIRKDNYFATSFEYYDLKGEHLKTMSLSDLVNVGAGRWRANHIEMRNVQSGHATVLQVLVRQLNIGLKDSDFTKSELEKGF